MDLEQYKKSRARFGEYQDVSVNVEVKNKSFIPKKDYPILETRTTEHGKEIVLHIQHGYCPCATCGHTYSYECDEAGCECCSSMCT